MRPTVLVVDDELDARVSLSELLEGAGYRVVGADNGEEAIAQLNRITRPVAIVLDLFMPQMNGWRFVEHLSRRVDWSDIPVVVLTAVGPYWGTPVPSDRVLRKPVQADRLLELLNQVTGS